MKFRSPVEYRRPELTVLPMVNVVFLLLIFFMLVARIAATDTSGVSPPVSYTGELEFGRWVDITIASDGSMLVAGDRVDTTVMLTSAVTQLVQNDPQTRLQLRADAALDANRLIRIMEVLRQGGVRELSLLIEREQ